MFDDDDDEDPTKHMNPEEKAKHQEFEKRRNSHYSNEADAMKKAKELLQKELDEDEAMDVDKQ